MRSLRHALGLLFLSVASLAASLGAVELLLRWNVIPNEYYLRNQVLGNPKEDGLFLFILGDSFMAPMKGSDIVDHLYSTLAPHGVRIRNTATSGTGPLQYFQNLRREGPRYRPDVLLLSYYVGNDLLDTGCRGDLDERLLPTAPLPAWKRTYTVQYLGERLRAVFPGRAILQSTVLGTGLLTHVLERTLRDAAPAQSVDYDRMKKAGIPEEHIESARAGKLNPWIVSLGATDPDYFRDGLLIRSDRAQCAWERTTRVLDRILDEAARLDADVLPVIFPQTLQVDTAHYALYRAWKIHVDDEMLRTNRPQQLLRQYFEARGLEPLDLLDAFRTADERLYWDQDEHMNTRGQQFAAQLISEAFLARYGDAGRSAGHPGVTRPRYARGKPRPAAPPALAPVSLPFHLAFDDSASRRLMESGWGQVESSGGRSYTWSAGEKSVLWVPIPRHGAIRMDFEASPFAFPRSPLQRVTIVLNGTVVEEVPLRPGLHQYSVILPRITLRDSPNMLEFRYGYARVPQEVLPDSPDRRTLAVAWYSINFTMPNP